MNHTKYFLVKQIIFVALVAAVFAIMLIIAPVCNNASAVSQDVPHTIFVTFNGDAHTRRGFTWLTDKFSGNSKLEVSTQSNFTKAVTIPASAYSITGGDRTNTKIGEKGITQYGHKALATSLNPGTKYYYRVGTDGSWSNVGSFMTEPENCSQFSFIDVTDTQAAISAGLNNNDYYNGWAPCIAQAFLKDPSASFVMSNGDMVDNGGDLVQWQAFTDSAKSELLNTTFVPVSGNHETYEADKILNTKFVSNEYGTSGICGTYKDAVIDHFNLSLPSTEKEVHEGAYYSFDYGNARFMILNTNFLNLNGTLSDEQINWLNEECKNSTQKWKIVSMHRSVQSDGGHMSQADIMALRNQLLKVMAADGVDIVLQGHDHIYLRSKPIGSNANPVENVEKITENIGGISTTFDVNPKGTVYIVPGASDDQFYQNRYDTKSRDPNISFASKHIFIAKNIPSRSGATMDLTPDGKGRSPTFADIKISDNKLYCYCYQYNTASSHLEAIDSYAILKTNAIANVPLAKSNSTFVQMRYFIIILALSVFLLLICFWVCITKKKHRQK